MTALDTFRESIDPLAVAPPNQIANITGSTAPCGFVPDVYGNNAYFNNLCANSIGPSWAIAGILSGVIGAPLTSGQNKTVQWNTHNEGTSPNEIAADTATAPFTYLICPYTGFYLVTVIGLAVTPFATGSLTLYPVSNVPTNPTVLANLTPTVLAGINGNIEFTIVQNYNAGQPIGIGLTANQSGETFTDAGAVFTLVFLGK